MAIRKSSRKRIGPGSLVRYPHRASVRIDDAPARTRHPSVGHHRQNRAPGRSARHRGQILVAKAPTAHQQPRTATGANLNSSDRWLANSRILEVDEIKSIPYVPVSHPFVERLIGTIRREFLDHVLIWNAIDLERKLEEFRNYYNAIAFISRSVAELLRKYLANHRPPMPSLITTLGNNIAAVCSRCQSLHIYEFATHRRRP